MGLPAVFDAKPSPDKAKLWDELKAELEGDKAGHIFHDYNRLNSQLSPWMAKKFLDRMNQAEIFATHVRPATPQDFDRVRTELKGEPHA